MRYRVVKARSRQHVKELLERQHVNKSISDVVGSTVLGVWEVITFWAARSDEHTLSVWSRQHDVEPSHLRVVVVRSTTDASQFRCYNTV